jgi:hydrogenase maturation protease
MAKPAILIAGIGNIFLGDDGFGVAVAKRLMSEPLPEPARVVDFGIRSFDLAFALLDAYEVTIFVDAVARGAEPGTLFLIEPDLTELDAAAIDSHSMNLMKALSLAKTMGGQFKRILLIGCEPLTLESDAEMELSQPVAAAIDQAVAMILSLVNEILDQQE